MIGMIIIWILFQKSKEGEWVPTHPPNNQSYWPHIEGRGRCTCPEHSATSLDGLFLLSEPESVEWDAGNLHNSESDTRKITDGMAWTTETSNEHLVVLVDEGHATISRNEASDSLVVFLELDSHTLSDGRVGLLGLDGNLLDDDAGSVGSALEGLSPLGNLIRLVEVVVSPSKRELGTITISTCWFFCGWRACDPRWYLLAFLLPLLNRYEIPIN